MRLFEGVTAGGPAGRFWEEAESHPHLAGVGRRALGLAQGLSLVRMLGNPMPGKQLRWRPMSKTLNSNSQL